MGPGLFELLAHNGKEETLRRLHHALAPGVSDEGRSANFHPPLFWDQTIKIVNERKNFVLSTAMTVDNSVDKRMSTYLSPSGNLPNLNSIFQFLMDIINC